MPLARIALAVMAVYLSVILYSGSVLADEPDTPPAGDSGSMAQPDAPKPSDGQPPESPESPKSVENPDSKSDSAATSTLPPVGTDAPASSDGLLSVPKKPSKEELQSIYKLIVQSQLMMKESKNEEARALLLKAATYNPSPYSMHTHYFLGVMLEKAGDKKGAMQEFDAATKFKPMVGSLLIDIGDHYKREGMNLKALRCYELYTRYYPTESKTPRIEAMIDHLKTAGLDADTSDVNAPDYVSFGTHKHLRAWVRGRMPLGVYIQSGAGIKGYHYQYRNYLVKALDDWSEASHGRMNWGLVSDPKYADIEVNWISAQDKFAGGDGGSKAGLTISYGDPQLQKCIIQIWTMYLGDDEIRQTCLHEVGHALGLEHSPNKGDALYWSILPKPVTKLSERDTATMAKLYRVHPAWMPQKAAPSKSSFVIEYASPPAGASSSAKASAPSKTAPVSSASSPSNMSPSTSASTHPGVPPPSTTSSPPSPPSQVVPAAPKGK